MIGMNKFKIGDEVIGSRGYTFDPATGIVKKLSKDVDGQDTAYVKINKATGDKRYYSAHSWVYRTDQLKLIPKDWDE